MVESLIIIYIFICVAMIIFDCFFIVLMNIRHKAGTTRLEKNKNRIVRQLQHIANGEEIEHGHEKKLIKALKNPVMLRHFSEALDLIEEEIANGTFCFPTKHEEERVPVLPKDGTRYLMQYLMHFSITAEKLFEKYRKKDPIIYTYYVFFLRKHGLLKHIAKPAVIASLKDFLEEGDIHVCENVLQAIYSIGEPNIVLQALKIVDKKEIFVHPKMISDGLLSYHGDAYVLQTLLLDELSRFTVQMQVNILNYIRFSSGKHCERVFALLLDEKTDDEVKFSCIRYFGKYKYEKAYYVLSDFAEHTEGRKNEYCLVSLTSLRNYPGEDTVSLLKKNLRSANWYIRYNAAESLNALGIDYGDLVDIFDGKDRFSRDILQFQFDRRYVKDKEEIYL